MIDFEAEIAKLEAIETKHVAWLRMKDFLQRGGYDGLQRVSLDLAKGESKTVIYKSKGNDND